MRSAIIFILSALLASHSVANAAEGNEDTSPDSFKCLVITKIVEAKKCEAGKKCSLKAEVECLLLDTSHDVETCNFKKGASISIEMTSSEMVNLKKNEKVKWRYSNACDDTGCEKPSWSYEGIGQCRP